MKELIAKGIACFVTAGITASLIEATKCTIEDSKRLKKLSDVCKKCDEVLKEE